MSAGWLVVLGAALGTIAIKASGPLVLGSRPLPAAADRVMVLLAPAILSGLVAVQTLGSGKHLVLDARAAGLAAAGVCLVLRAPLILTVVVAAVVTAGLRSLAG